MKNVAVCVHMPIMMNRGIVMKSDTVRSAKTNEMAQAICRKAHMQ